MKRIASIMLGVCALGLSTAVVADNNFNNLRLLSQQQFKTLTENLGAAASYKALTPAEPLGTLGFDLGLELTTTEIDEAIFDLASAGGWSLSSLPVPKLHAHKGLPLGIDVGAFYTSVPDTDIKLFGAELRYALLKGGIASPAVALRGTYSKLAGVDELDLQTAGIEASISKGFVMLTPYAGIGRIFTSSEAVGVTNLNKEDIEQGKLYAGVNINLGVNLVLELDRTGDYTTYSVKLGYRF